MPKNQANLNSLDIAKIAVSIEKINSEMGCIRDRLTSMEVNMGWVKWFVLTSAGALIMGIVNLFFILHK